MLKFSVAALVALLGSSLPVAAQVVEVVGTGDATQHSGRVVGIEAVFTSGPKSFHVQARTDHTEPRRRQVLFGWLSHYEPGAYGFAGRQIDRARGGKGDISGGHSVAILKGPLLELLYYFTGGYADALVLTGTPATDLGLPATTTYTRLDRIGMKRSRFVLRGQIEDASGVRRGFLSKGEINFVIQQHDLVVTEGDTLPQLGLPLVRILEHDGAAATDDFNRVIWLGTVDAGGGNLRTGVFRPKKCVALEGDVSPVPGRRWGSLADAVVDMGDKGSWTLVARLDESDPATAPVIVRNGAVLRQAGQSLAAIAPQKLVGFGQTQAFLAPRGWVLWFAETDHPDAGRDEVLFLNDTPLIREGVTRFLGQRVVGFGEGPPVYHLEALGRTVIVRVVLEDGREVALLIDIELGEHRCNGGVNSLGLRAPLQLRGFASIERNTFALTVNNLPPDVPVVLLVGEPSTKKPFSNGFLCVGDNPLRVTEGMADGEGHFALDLDLRDLADRGGWVPGDRVNFQLWYQDPGGAFPVNLSEAVRLDFE